MRLIIPDDITCYDLADTYPLQPLEQRWNNLAEAVFSPSNTLTRHNIDSYFKEEALFVFLRAASKPFKDKVKKRCIDNKNEYRLVEAFDQDNAEFNRWISKRR